jgi:hypothetical protein
MQSAKCSSTRVVIVIRMHANAAHYGFEATELRSQALASSTRGNNQSLRSCDNTMIARNPTTCTLTSAQARRRNLWRPRDRHEQLT